MPALAQLVPFFAADERLIAVINLLAVLGGIGLIFTVAKATYRFLKNWVRNGLLVSVKTAWDNNIKAAKVCRRDPMRATVFFVLNFSGIAISLAGLGTIAIVLGLYVGPDLALARSFLMFPTVVCNLAIFYHVVQNFALCGAIMKVVKEERQIAVAKTESTIN